MKMLSNNTGFLMLSVTHGRGFGVSNFKVLQLSSQYQKWASCGKNEIHKLYELRLCRRFQPCYVNADLAGFAAISVQLQQPAKQDREKKKKNINCYKVKIMLYFGFIYEMNEHDTVCQGEETQPWYITLRLSCHIFESEI